MGSRSVPLEISTKQLESFMKVDEESGEKYYEGIIGRGKPFFDKSDFERFPGPGNQEYEEGSDQPLLTVPAGTSYGRHNQSPEQWGPHGWHFLHSVAWAYPEFPTLEDMRRMAQTLANLSFQLPCERCRLNWSYKFNKLFTPYYLRSRHHLQLFLIYVHMTTKPRHKVDKEWVYNQVMGYMEEYGVDVHMILKIDELVKSQRIVNDVLFEQLYIKPNRPVLHPTVEKYAQTINESFSEYDALILGSSIQEGQELMEKNETSTMTPYDFAIKKRSEDTRHNHHGRDDGHHKDLHPPYTEGPSLVKWGIFGIMTGAIAAFTYSIINGKENNDKLK